MAAPTVTPKKWGLLIAKVWEDDKLRKRLLSDPAAVLKEHGLEAPPGVKIKVVENTDKVVYLTLPSKPQFDELEDMNLDRPKLSRPPQTLPCFWPLCIRCL